jgi:AcrR family transcriptional regulator
MTLDQQARLATPAQTRRRSRREEILQIAVGLFASRGYHGVSMDDIGAAAGVTGPALYHHFKGKEAMLASALIPVSEQLLAGGKARIDEHPDEPKRQIRRLQRLYVEEWVQTLAAVRPDLDATEARVLAHGAFGLMNSTPFQGGEVGKDRTADLLRAATLSALRD